MASDPIAAYYQNSHMLELSKFEKLVRKNLKNPEKQKK